MEEPTLEQIPKPIAAIELKKQLTRSTIAYIGILILNLINFAAKSIRDRFILTGIIMIVICTLIVFNLKKMDYLDKTYALKKNTFQEITENLKKGGFK